MFWSSAGTSSNIDQVLDDPAATLDTVLEQDEVLQELRAQNKKLVEFLCRPESLSGMLDLITREPSSDVPLLSQYKLPNVACEILTSDNAFVEKVTGDKSYLDKLFFFFRDSRSPINPLLASYASRVLGEIASRKLDQNWYSYQLNLIQIMGYLQSEPSVLDWLLSHMDCSAVCEFFYKLMLNVEGQDMRNSLYEWLIETEKLILRIVEKMNRNELEDVHANISRLMGDLLYAFQDDMINSSSADCDPFLLAIRSHETITRLLQTLFAPDNICETSIMHGLDLILSLLGITRRSPRQSGRNDCLDEVNGDGGEVILSEAIKEEILNRMPVLLTLLQSPVDPKPLKLSSGVLENPVGLGRLAIAKFIAHLFMLKDAELNEGIIRSGVLSQLMDLFWSHPWNNFLHRFVSKILIYIAKSAPVSPFSAEYVIKDLGILQKIIQVFENKENNNACFRGHLSKVAVAFGEAFCLEADTDEEEKGKDVEQPEQQNEEKVTQANFIKRCLESDKDLLEKWENFYGDTLDGYMAAEQVLLAGVNPPTAGGLISGGMGLGSGSLPFTDNDASSSSSTMQWLSFTAAAQSMLTGDFDTADSLLNISIGGLGNGDDGSSSSKAKSLFEMFCNEKSNSFDDEEEEREGSDDDDDGTFVRKKHSFDLSSPDSDSLEDEPEKKLTSLNLNSSLNIEDIAISDEDEEEIFSADRNKPIKSPPIPIPVVGVDPWSNQEISEGDTAAAAAVVAAATADPWTMNNPFESGSGAHQENADAGWANFEQVPSKDSKADGDSDWANFEQPQSVKTEIKPEVQEGGHETSNNPFVNANAKCTTDNVNANGAVVEEEWAEFASAAAIPSEKDSINPVPVVVSNEIRGKEESDGNQDQQASQLQSPAAKDDPVSSASQQVSAAN